MKQHITPKQLNELSEKGKEKLRKWWKPKEGDWFISKDAGYDIVRTWPYIDDKNRIESSEWDGIGGYNDFYLEDCLPLLSIGQMIEFLGTELSITIGQEKEGYSIGISRPDSYAYIPTKELADALWEACKEILE